MAGFLDLGDLLKDLFPKPLDFFKRSIVVKVRIRVNGLWQYEVRPAREEKSINTVSPFCSYTQYNAPFRSRRQTRNFQEKIEWANLRVLKWSPIL